jgi:hypothetical protein
MRTARLNLFGWVFFATDGVLPDGPLRVERPLRGVYTGLGGTIFFGKIIPANGRADAGYFTWTS